MGEPKQYGPRVRGCLVIIGLIVLVFIASQILTHQPPATTTVPSSSSGDQPGTSSSQPPVPTPNPAFYGLTLNSAADMVAAYYREHVHTSAQDGNADYVMNSIASMTMPNPQNNQFVACVAYRPAPPFAPDQPVQGYPRTQQFTFQYDGSTWQVINMGGTCAQNDDGTIPGGQEPQLTKSASPPTIDQARYLVATYYNNQHLSDPSNSPLLLNSVTSITFGTQEGNYIGACVHYTYTEGTTENQFGFEYQNGNWIVNSIGDTC